MSTSYIANTGGLTGSRGVWRVSSTDYQYQYAAFIPGQDVNLDQVSITTNIYITGQSAPNNFQVGLYGSGVNAITPGSLISVLSGPSSPAESATSNYIPTTTLSLSSDTQYWLGFTLSSDTGGSNSTRVKIGHNPSSNTTLGAGWSVPANYENQNGVGSDPNSATYGLIFSLSGYVPASVPCFYQGTQITLTDGITISVEDLNIGDLIHTHKGPMPLKWLGRRKVTKSARQEYPHQLPVVIESGALGVNMPSTNLMVSEGHTILVEGHLLICAHLLENDINCYRANCDDLPDDFEYFHLEFAEEEVLLLSNGALTASYVNIQTRMVFDNYQEYIDLYGDLNAVIKPLEYKYRRTGCFLDPYKAVVRRSFQEPASLCTPN